MSRIKAMGWSANRKHFNGKPIAHWEKMAEELVVSTLVRASFSIDSLSLPGQIASRKIMGMALGVNRVMVAEVVETRDRCQQSMQEFLKFLLPDPPKKPRKKKRR